MEVATRFLELLSRTIPITFEDVAEGYNTSEILLLGPNVSVVRYFKYFPDLTSSTS
jgi:hypothetical protein